MEKAYLSLLNSFFFLIFVFINPKSFLAFKINTHKLKQAFRQNCPSGLGKRGLDAKHLPQNKKTNKRN
ncbi:hypothetical protein LEP1GSC191_2644 [Leptospira borgpetersenii serovar Mini str. 201000851]|nr:hypothetical protein LEP1GSC191_2644 [Leptospira borgpetersenii serovar Mini str. 201000851]